MEEESITITLLKNGGFKLKIDQISPLDAIALLGMAAKSLKNINEIVRPESVQDLIVHQIEDNDKINPIHN